MSCWKRNPLISRCFQAATDFARSTARGATLRHTTAPNRRVMSDNGSSLCSTQFRLKKETLCSNNSSPDCLGQAIGAEEAWNSAVMKSYWTLFLHGHVHNSIEIQPTYLQSFLREAKVAGSTILLLVSMKFHSRQRPNTLLCHTHCFLELNKFSQQQNVSTYRRSNGNELAVLHCELWGTMENRLCHVLQNLNLRSEEKLQNLRLCYDWDWNLFPPKCKLWRNTTNVGCPCQVTLNSADSCAMLWLLCNVVTDDGDRFKVHYGNSCQ